MVPPTVEFEVDLTSLNTDISNRCHQRPGVPRTQNCSPKATLIPSLPSGVNALPGTEARRQIAPRIPDAEEVNHVPRSGGDDTGADAHTAI